MNPPSSLPNHFVDIHEVLQEEDEEEEETKTTTTKPPDDHHDKPPEKPSSKPNARPAMRKPSNYRSLGRQVSLETGFARARDDRERRGALPRSGRSFGGFDYEAASRVNNKGDFSMFRTKSSLSKQNSLVPSRNINNNNNITNDNSNNNNNNNNQDQGGSQGNDESLNKSVPAGRYFAALRGPELDQVKEYEDILLPKDETWPFLLRFPINCFGICLGLSSQAVLWRSLASSPATSFLRIGPIFNLVLWLLAVASLLAVSLTYALKCLFYFEAVKREYFHPVRVNFFFAPWVVCMFLAISVPSAISSVTGKLHPAIWCAFMGPYFFLELKIYGQWLSGGKRRLCMVANPSSHLSVVGNFVGAILAAKVGWLEPAKFLWSIGFAHYLVLFVTLYQRLPTSEALPKELHPVYSMFIAAPSAASLAWHAIYEEFDGLSRTCYFIALFLYISLVVRLNFFIGFKFSLAWWSYTFPMTTASVATIKYAESVPTVISKGMAVSLSFGSSLMVCVLFVCTLLHIFVWQTLFPNDLAIAITKRRHQQAKERKPLKQRWTVKHHANKDVDANKEEGN